MYFEIVVLQKKKNLKKKEKIVNLIKFLSLNLMENSNLFLFPNYVMMFNVFRYSPSQIINDDYICNASNR